MRRVRLLAPGRPLLGARVRFVRYHVALTFLAASSLAAADDSDSSAALRSQARAGLERAVDYYHGQVASHGGYVYYYSLDLKQRWGEGAATPNQIFVQPPGTPTVGAAYLRAHAATGDRRFLAAARDAATALLHGQLESGGWTQTIDFDPTGTKAARYRHSQGRRDGRNHTSLDDNQTQAAIAFLAQLDRALDFKDVAVGEAVRYALDALLRAQFPNGAFPQGFTGPSPRHPILRASYPREWPRTWPNENYWNFYTLNDGLAGTVCDTLLAAFAVYQDRRYTAALGRLGDFLLLAQMPEPQPAWCQQYNPAMQPAWARRFEPSAIATLESEDAIRTLLKIARHTGERRYLEPIPRALAYLRQHPLSGALMPRFLELHTDRALYLTRNGSNYSLAYDDANLPAHNGWKQTSSLDSLTQEFAELQRGESSALSSASGDAIRVESNVREILRNLDAEGRWISTYAGERLVGQPKFVTGFRYIDSAVFARNVELLSDYLALFREKAR